MNQATRPEESELETLDGRLSAWRELIERCEKKPTRKRVHALRVATLRIQAEVEDELNDLPLASREAQAMVRFGKVAEKLRKALGSVRELDVWAGKLSGLRESLCESAEYVPRSTRETARQVEQLEGRLIKKRERAGLKLVAEIEKRYDDLISASHEVEKAAVGKADGTDSERAIKLLKDFEAIAMEFPAFDEENLHEFRKKIKKIRYVAEIHSGDPDCERIAAQVKKAQDGIGEWHDWQVLARTAESGKHSKYAEAVELLVSVATETYKSAIATCDRVLRQMADMERYRDATPRARKLSVHSESAGSESARKSA